MEPEAYYVVAFDSTHRALAAAAVLDEGRVPYLTIPTPREISAGCGIALRCRPPELDALRAAVEAEGPFGEDASLWEVEGPSYKRLS